MSNLSRKMSVIGYGNMAKALVAGVLSTSYNEISEIILFDTNNSQYGNSDASTDTIRVSVASSLEQAVESADCILLSVKPQNYPEVLSLIKGVEGFDKKLYISIAAGITSSSVSDTLNGACVIRVLPNVPILIGEGVSVICSNEKASTEDFDFICNIFRCASTPLIIDEIEMNRIISVTSSSPAYVFKFINAIYRGALEQNITDNDLLDSICDMVIGSANMLKQSKESPDALISKVASKGGTTEQALRVLDENNFEDTIKKAMLACTARADELGSIK